MKWVGISHEFNILNEEHSILSVELSQTERGWKPLRLILHRREVELARAVCCHDFLIFVPKGKRKLKCAATLDSRRLQISPKKVCLVLKNGGQLTELRKLHEILSHRCDVCPIDSCLVLWKLYRASNFWFIEVPLDGSALYSSLILNEVCRGNVQCAWNGSCRWARAMMVEGSSQVWRWIFSEICGPIDPDVGCHLKV